MSNKAWPRWLRLEPGRLLEAGEMMDEVTIELLANRPDVLASVGEIRWREWGHLPEPVDLQWWVNVTRNEAGREALPITWVALASDGQAVGAVGLADYDLDERRDRTPWLVGMIVVPERRGRRIGERLVRALEQWASSHGYQRLWVATGGRAVKFYEKCGWEYSEEVLRGNGENPTVLTRVLK